MAGVTRQDGGLGIDPADTRYGIEAEFGLVHPDRGLVDFESDAAESVQRLVDRLPDHGDADLTRGDLAIKWTRWYVEGDERFDESGRFLSCVPKGVETRTPISRGIDATMRALVNQTNALCNVAAIDGLRLTAMGYNPFRASYQPMPPYNTWERQMRRTHSEYAAEDVYMCSYGPDVNLSHPAWNARDTVRVGRTLARCAPALVAFSLSAPFAGGRRWPGYSARTFARAGRRPAVRVFLAEPLPEMPPCPGLFVRGARISAEIGRIEFKAFDAFPDLDLFAPLMALVTGLALAPSVPSGPEIDVAAHLRLIAHRGFEDQALTSWCAALIDTAAAALAGTDAQDHLEPLRESLHRRRVPAHALIDAYDSTGEIGLPNLGIPRRYIDPIMDTSWGTGARQASKVSPAVSAMFFEPKG